MPINLTDYLVIGISTRALFNLEKENEIFKKKGLEAYCKYQIEHENDVLEPGTGFELVKAFLKLNDILTIDRKSEVVIISQNSADTGLRIFNSIREHKLNISRGAFTRGRPVAKYLNCFNVDLFLSASENDVREALELKIPAGLIYPIPKKGYTMSPMDEIRIAFDGDAVIFSDEAEKIFQTQGLDAFQEHERQHANQPLLKGPLAKFLYTISYLQHDIPEDKSPIRTALVTARNSPAHERVIKTLRNWNVRIDETFFLGGMDKSEVLYAFEPHIFFDDQDLFCKNASEKIPTARVPSKTTEKK